MQTMTIPYRQPTRSGLNIDQANKKKEFIEALVRLQSNVLLLLGGMNQLQKRHPHIRFQYVT